MTNGHAVYAKICFACHKVNDEGIDFGPALSEIGSKLPKEALYASIIDPNAAISFGFEGWEVKTKKGDTYVGMVAGETDAELSLKTPGGVIVKTPKSEISARKKMDISLMPRWPARYDQRTRVRGLGGVSQRPEEEVTVRGGRGNETSAQQSRNTLRLVARGSQHVAGLLTSPSTCVVKVEGEVTRPAPHKAGTCQGLAHADHSMLQVS